MDPAPRSSHKAGYTALWAGLVSSCDVTQRPWTKPGFSRPLLNILSSTQRPESTLWVTAWSRNKKWPLGTVRPS